MERIKASSRDLLIAASKKFKEEFYGQLEKILNSYGVEVFSSSYDPRKTTFNYEILLFYYNDLEWEFAVDEHGFAMELREDVPGLGVSSISTNFHDRMEDVFEIADRGIDKYKDVLAPIQKMNRLKRDNKNLDDIGMFEVKRFNDI